MDVDAEIRATRGRVLGEAVWRRICLAANVDPKDPGREREHQALVKAVGSALMTLDESGFEGLEYWLNMEEAWNDGGPDDNT